MMRTMRNGTGVRSSNKRGRKDLYFRISLGCVIFALTILVVFVYLIARNCETKKKSFHIIDDSVVDCCGLAREQSFGFFADISDENWKRAQLIHAQIFPNHFRKDLKKYSNGPGDKGVVSKLGMSKDWNGENFQEEFHCPLSRRIPSTGEADGPKWVCDPHRIALQPSCLVYSIGSNGNVMFERGVKEEISEGCEIHTFDMVTYNKRNGNFATALKDYATFHDWGIGTEEEAQRYKNTGRGPKMKTIKQTMEELGHVGRTIDIFKIDCEWCEWFTYKDWLDSGDLRQILVETHNAPMPNARDFFYFLHDSGYVIFSKEANFVNGGGGVEFAFLKLRTSFFVNGSMYNQAEV